MASPQSQYPDTTNAMPHASLLSVPWGLLDPPRQTEPHHREDFAKNIDEGILSLVQTSTGLLISDLGRDSRYATRAVGSGRTHTVYVGAFCTTFCPDALIIDRTDGKGNLLKGRLHLPSIDWNVTSCLIFRISSVTHAFYDDWLFTWVFSKVYLGARPSNY